MTQPAPLNLAIVGDRYDPAGGGAERSTLQTANALAHRGHAVTLLAGSGEPGQLSANLQVQTYRAGRSSSAARLRGFANWARAKLDAGGFDASLSTTPAVAATVVQPRGGTVVETQRRNIEMRIGGLDRLNKRLSFALSPKQRLLRSLEARTYADPRLQRVAALSGYVRKQLREHYRIDDARIASIPNLAAPPSATPDERAAQRRAFRQALSLDDATAVFVFAAENPRLKGLPTLLDALAQLPADTPPLVVLLIGRIGFAVDQRAQAMGIGHLVRVLGATRRMDLVYAAGDAVVHPTHYDPSSKVVLEGLLYGLPAITTAYNGAADHLLPPGAPAPRGVVLSDPSDPAALCEALQRLADPQQRAEMARAIGNATVELSIDAHVDRLEALMRACATA